MTKKLSVVDINKDNPAFDPDHVLECAKGEYGGLMIIGYNKDGELDIRASTNILRKDMIWLMESAKLYILD